MCMCVKKILPGSFRGCKCSEFWVAWGFDRLWKIQIYLSRESCHINVINIFWALIGMTCHEDHGDQATGGGGMREDDNHFFVCVTLSLSKKCVSWCLMPQKMPNITWKCTPPSRMTVTRIHTITCSVRNPSKPSFLTGIFTSWWWGVGVDPSVYP